MQRRTTCNEGIGKQDWEGEGGFCHLLDYLLLSLTLVAIYVPWIQCHLATKSVFSAQD